MDTYSKANLDWWNEVVGVHAQGNTYGLEAFKAGISKLKYLEREEVGEVTRKSLLHLQCHFGLTLFIVRSQPRFWSLAL